MLSYLPGDIETMKGQDILLDDFGKGAYATVVVKGMDSKSLSKLEDKISKVDHVAQVISYNSLVGTDIPSELIPDKYRSVFENKETGATLFAIFFDDTTSSDATMQAVEDIRSQTKGECYLSSMSAIVTDTKYLSVTEAPMYVLIAVISTSIVLALLMDSFLVPVVFMLSIGIAIIYNLGSNYFLGQVSYITKALAAVLQLGVTLDYSIFLWHSYKEMKLEHPQDHARAMAMAIDSTVVAILGSSATAIAGFLSMCFMSFTLGLDLGIVMAKGCAIGVIASITLLPSLILTFDRALEKTMHRELLPARFDKLAKFVVNHAWIFILTFVIVMIPGIYGYVNTQKYYNLQDTLPATLDSTTANRMVQENFSTLNSVYMVLADSSLSSKQANKMEQEIGNVDGVTFALGYDSLLGYKVPDELVPDSVKSNLKGNQYQLIMVASDYKVASDEVNNQISEVNEIVKKYDSSAMVIGEAPCTKDLITITDKDFKTVHIISIGAIFLIIFCIFGSISLPVVLVTAIEFAIFINMGLPYYFGITIPFIASVVIDTIQLGVTVDYAILMTTRYRKERFEGADRKEAVITALSTSVPSVVVSALGFFAATFGVGLYSSVDMIASLCSLMAKGAVISMFVVIFILPSFLVVFDKIIIHTSRGFVNKQKKIKEKQSQVAYVSAQLSGK
jgi:predicted RND superfamily exporter protein